MTILFLFLYMTSAIFFLLTAFGIAAQRINLLALGLFCWVLVPLIQIALKL